jgi:hypothetical protein
MNWPQKNTARPAATKTVPRERLAQRRRGAEKDQEETPGMVFSAPLRLCAKKSLREGVILPDCGAKIAKKMVIPYAFPGLQCVRVAHFREVPTTDDDRIFNAKAQRREGAKSFFHLGVLASLRLCVEMPFFYP